MHKDELLQLHSLLCQVKRYFEDAGLPLNGEFKEDSGLNCSPQHIHKSKTDHKRAVFFLGKGLSEVVMQGNADQQARLRERFIRLATTTTADDDEDGLSHAVGRDAGLPAFALAALRHAPL